MQAGDIVFVRPTIDDWTGALIAEATRGPYSHVRVAISSREVIEALPTGIARSLVGDMDQPHVVDVATTGSHLQVDRRAHALAWLIRQKGDPYNWFAIGADTLGIILPQRLGSRTPFLVAPSRYDCSELAARFLTHAGYKWLPDAMADYPTRVSPNDLARALGVLNA